MIDKKIAAVIIAVVIVAASVGAYAFLNRNNDNANSIDVDTSLTIMGNANNDYTIDSEDIDIATGVMNGTYSLSDYPLSDANNDGAVDSSDIAIIQKLVNRESTTVYVIDQADDIVEVTYPLTNVISINPDMLTLVIQIGGADNLAGFIASVYGPEQSIVRNDTSITDLGTSRLITAASWKMLTDLDASLESSGGIGAILAMNDTALGNYASDIKTAGIPVLKILCSEPTESIDASLTLGFLFGTETEKTSLNFVSYSQSVMAYIEERLGTVETKETCLAMCMGTYIAQIDSQYTTTTTLAGGNNLTDISGSSSTKLTNAETITKYNVNYIINFDTMGFQNVNAVSEWEVTNLQYISSSSAYENMVFLNASMPMVCKVAYIAELLYPNLFDDGYADSVFQNFIDGYFPYMDSTQSDGDFDVTTDCTTMLTYTEYKAAGGTK
jgi:iron complex transport system substrate-binding protein